MKPFIPAWLDEAGLSAAEMRVFVHLLRSADNVTGVAWPSYQRMTEICRLGKTTVRRSLKELEARKMISKKIKPFGSSCRYLILPIVPPREQMEDPNSSTTGTIETPPIVPPQDCNSPSDGTSIVPPQGQEGNPRKVIQERFSTSLSETVWNMTPLKGKERSSRKQLEAALKKVPKSITEATIIHALESWKKSESWTKENGKFIPGIHRWINDGKWETIPESSQAPTGTIVTGGRAFRL